MPTPKKPALVRVVQAMNLPTDPAEYKAARKARGTQAEVAEALGVNRVTVANRESGSPRYPISTEAALALLSLPEKKTAK